MYSKIAFAQKVLRGLATAGKAAVKAKVPLAAGAAVAVGAHAAHKGLTQDRREYQAGFLPGVAESKVD